MIFKIIVSFFLILCVVGILSTCYKTNKKYKQYCSNAMIKSSTEMSKIEKSIRLIAILLGPVLLGGVLLSILFELYNERLLLTLVISYLIIYYINQYLPHSNWIMHKEGLISSGSNRCIKWGNISRYSWLKKNNYDILIIQFKGSGLMAQRKDFIISSKEAKQVKEILSERVLSEQF